MMTLPPTTFRLLWLLPSGGMKPEAALTLLPDLPKPGFFGNSGTSGTSSSSSYWLSPLDISMSSLSTCSSSRSWFFCLSNNEKSCWDIDFWYPNIGSDLFFSGGDGSTPLRISSWNRSPRSADLLSMSKPNPRVAADSVRQTTSWAVKPSMTMHAVKEAENARCAKNKKNQRIGRSRGSKLNAMDAKGIMEAPTACLGGRPNRPPPFSINGSTAMASIAKQITRPAEVNSRSLARTPREKLLPPVPARHCAPKVNKRMSMLKAANPSRITTAESCQESSEGSLQDTLRKPCCCSALKMQATAVKARTPTMKCKFNLPARPLM
mmetsp:Transcript_154988/g.496764  ORF Transcript_154988/g.496764 Transcript_154988/m.496764 type:complete len:322 (+) Transcript_154988:3150-4115(+)